MDAYKLLVLLKEGRLILYSLIALQMPLVENLPMYRPSREAPLQGSDFILMTA
ncbi:hypothetical protein MITS9508_00409 [Synechococcus sp. MIT S9508]|uniref:hypothetical protein n=1 Tax=Synechococcus sp. MIT S9508 TaxID=1801629 RepID=UPI0007BBB4FF|nr:hypothetical protein MITS9508_00409 [Synechococcus sp. MIT S9508]